MSPDTHPHPLDASSPDVTQLLAAWRSGDPRAMPNLAPVLYAELRAMARRHLRRERVDHTLQPTALVHEAFFRLLDQSRMEWENRSQFFAVASLLMRRVLVDHARSQQAAKRQGNQQKLSLDEAVHVAGEGRPEDMLQLDQALQELAEYDERQSRVVELRYFMGLTIEEVAEVMEISPATVKRYWAQARAWLRKRLSDA